MNFYTKWRLHRAVKRAVKTYNIYYSYPPHSVRTEIKIIGKRWCWETRFIEDPNKRGSMREVFRTMYGYHSLGLSHSGVVGNSVRSKQKALVQSAYAEKLMNIALSQELLPKVAQYRFITDS